MLTLTGSHLVIIPTNSHIIGTAPSSTLLPVSCLLDSEAECSVLISPLGNISDAALAAIRSSPDVEGIYEDGMMATQVTRTQ